MAPLLRGLGFESNKTPGGPTNRLRQLNPCRPTSDTVELALVGPSVGLWELLHSSGIIGSTNWSLSAEAVLLCLGIAVRIRN
jgi:hypothetical protein